MREAARANAMNDTNRPVHVVGNMLLFTYSAPGAIIAIGTSCLRCRMRYVKRTDGVLYLLVGVLLSRLPGFQHSHSCVDRPAVY